MVSSSLSMRTRTSMNASVRRRGAGSLRKSRAHSVNDRGGLLPLDADLGRQGYRRGVVNEVVELVDRNQQVARTRPLVVRGAVHHAGQRVPHAIEDLVELVPVHADLIGERDGLGAAQGR